MSGQAVANGAASTCGVHSADADDPVGARRVLRLNRDFPPLHGLSKMARPLARNDCFRRRFSCHRVCGILKADRSLLGSRYVAGRRHF